MPPSLSRRTWPDKCTHAVNMKNFSSIMTFAGTMKSERMSGSPAIAIWIIANEKTSSEKKVMEKVLEAMEDT